MMKEPLVTFFFFPPHCQSSSGDPIWRPGQKRSSSVVSTCCSFIQLRSKVSCWQDERTTRDPLGLTTIPPVHHPTCHHCTLVYIEILMAEMIGKPGSIPHILNIRYGGSRCSAPGVIIHLGKVGRRRRMLFIYALRKLRWLRY